MFTQRSDIEHIQNGTANMKALLMVFSHDALVIDLYAD